jgi:hypothetical protein
LKKRYAIGRLATVVAVLLALIPLSALADTPEAEHPPHLNCMDGPAEDAFGGTEWYIYACDDGQSVIVMSERQNPAFPFYLILYPKDGVYRLFGEGGGRRSASDAAYADLQRLSPAQIAELYSMAKAVGPSRQH